MYARHFGLYDNIALDAAVELIERDRENERWDENLGRFRGRFMHSQAYKG